MLLNVIFSSAFELLQHPKELARQITLIDHGTFLVNSRVSKHNLLDIKVNMLLASSCILKLLWTEKKLEFIGDDITKVYFQKFCTLNTCNERLPQNRHTLTILGEYCEIVETRLFDIARLDG